MSEMSVEDARRVLGVDRGAKSSDIRAAWKEKARRYHPDQPGGCARSFVAIGAAYKTLKAAGWDHDDGFARAQKSARPAQTAKRSAPKKPAAERRGAANTAQENAPRRRSVTGALKSACLDLIRRAERQSALSEASRQNAGCYVDPRQIKSTPTRGASHVASGVQVDGRSVRIQVPGAMVQGPNAVSVPRGTRGKDGPALIRFSVPRSGTGRVPVASSIREAYFPWASSVEIAFTG